MQQIYSGSTLTIAASGAKNTSAGFFAHETPRFRSASVSVARAHFTFANSATGKMMNVQVQDRGGMHSGMAPILQTRGWALQESVLSHRIIQCVQSELYWRCNQGCQTESGLLLPITADLSWNVPVIDFEDMSGSHKQGWRLVEDYSGRSFTFGKDRLPAIAGLISYFRETTNDLPCLGMWNNSFHLDLAWMRAGRLSKKQASGDTEWDFPSWTWLSCPVDVIFEPAAANAPLELREIPMTVNSHVKIIDWLVFWQGHPFTSKLKSTRLFVEGPVQDLFIEIPAEAKTFKPPYCIINHKLSKDSKLPVWWRSIVQFDREEWNPAKTWACLLVLSAIYSDEQRKRREDTFLLIEPLSADPEPAIFRRVGIGVSRDDENTFSSAVQRTFHMV